MSLDILQAGKYPVHEIVVHCSATLPSWLDAEGIDAQLAEIRSWHIADRGWKDIGYHWLIGRKGEIRAGRKENVIGAGVMGHNRGVIHVCLIGGFGSAADDIFSDNFTVQQSMALRNQIKAIGSRTRITLLSGHNQYAAKACPGFSVPHWVDSFGGTSVLLGY